MKLLGIHGKARAGKDTIASYLTNNRDFERYAFADPIRDAVSTMFDLSEEQIHGNQKEKVIDWVGKSPRQLMQTLGTEWGRDLVHPDLWLKLAQRHWENLTEYCIDTFGEIPEGLVIPDVRFENEAKWIRENGMLIHVVRPDNWEVASHISEAGIEFDPKKGDGHILNSGTLEELHELLRVMFPQTVTP